MWPILATFTIGIAVVTERCFWWLRHSSRTNSENLASVYGALEMGDIPKASARTSNSEDPILQVIWHGLNHHHTSLENALQVAAGYQIENAGRFLSVFDRIITLAPLVGLLGTVTGIMSAFHFVGNEEVAALKVSGEIAA